MRARKRGVASVASRRWARSSMRRRTAIAGWRGARLPCVWRSASAERVWVRLLLGQSILLALAGAAFGLVAAHWGGGIMRALLLPDVDWSGATVTLRVFLFTAAIACVVGLATGLLPAMHAARADLNTALKSGARSVGGIATRTRSALTIAQAALSVVLLIGAGLFLRSLDNVRSIDLGFDADEVIAVTIPWSPLDELPRAARRAEEDRRYAALDALFHRVAAMPEVKSASLSQWSPLYSTMRVTLRVAGWDSVPALRGGGPYLSTVSSRYFETVGTTLLRARNILPTSVPARIVTPPSHTLRDFDELREIPHFRLMYEGWGEIDPARCRSTPSPSPAASHDHAAGTTGERYQLRSPVLSTDRPGRG